MHLDHDPNDPDDFAYNVPDKPSQLTSLTDEELFRLLRKVAFANRWSFDTKVQFEATSRLIGALEDFKTSSDRSAKVLIALTVVLVLLTAVIVWLTLELVQVEHA
jgi:hypothetical protein